MDRRAPRVAPLHTIPWLGKTHKLIAAAISGARGQNLIAKFIEIKPNAGKEMSVLFPAHSFTTHETTLMNIIRSSVSWTNGDDHKWHEARLDVIFSIPQDSPNYEYHFNRWYLVSLQVPDKPKSPRTATGK
jgi:uncharacterized protein YaiE (UPF0345 family)